MPNYYQPEIETMPYEQLRELQNERLVKQVRHVWDNVPYYRAKMEAKGVTIDDIHSVDDLHKLPFLTKDDLRDAYPYGLMGKLSKYFDIPQEEWMTAIEQSVPAKFLEMNKKAFALGANA